MRGRYHNRQYAGTACYYNNALSYTLYALALLAVLYLIRQSLGSYLPEETEQTNSNVLVATASASVSPGTGTSGLTTLDTLDLSIDNIFEHAQPGGVFGTTGHHSSENSELFDILTTKHAATYSLRGKLYMDETENGLLKKIEGMEFGLVIETE